MTDFNVGDEVEMVQPEYCKAYRKLVGKTLIVIKRPNGEDKSLTFFSGGDDVAGCFTYRLSLLSRSLENK